MKGGQIWQLAVMFQAWGNVLHEDLAYRFSEFCKVNIRNQRDYRQSLFFTHRTYNPHVPSPPCPSEHSTCGMQCYLCSCSLLQDTIPGWVYSTQRRPTCLEKGPDSAHVALVCTSLVHTPLCCLSQMGVLDSMRVQGTQHQGAWGLSQGLGKEDILSISIPHTVPSTWWEINKYFLNKFMSLMGHSSILTVKYIFKKIYIAHPDTISQGTIRHIGIP